MRPQTASFVSALGEEFRSAREARSLSLSDVAERLHIRSVYLAAIEEEDWHVIGAPVYVRGFMRTYARFLGLDPEAAVARFSASVPAGTPAATAPPRAAATTAERRSAERSSPSLAAVLSIVVAVLVVAFVGYEFYQYRPGTPVPPVTDASAAPGTVAGAPAPADLGSAAPAGNGDQSSLAAIPPVVSPVPRAAPAARRGLALNVTETSWLRVTVDGRVVLEGTLPSGAAKSFSGKVADVRVGNAGGVRIAVNGKPLGPLGASGDVVERRYVLTGE
jgi:cytoskeleton protein RodZ